MRLPPMSCTAVDAAGASVPAAISTRMRCEKTGVVDDSVKTMRPPSAATRMVSTPDESVPTVTA